MRRVILSLFIYVSLSFAWGWSDPYEEHDDFDDLPPDGGVNVKVIKRIPDDECTAQAGIGMKLKVHYTAWIAETGQTFASTLFKGDPFVFVLGETRITSGWDAGFFNMCLGEKRSVIVASGSAYGERGHKSIPPGATIVYDTELLSIDEKEVEVEEEEEEMRSEL